LSVDIEHAIALPKRKNTIVSEIKAAFLESEGFVIATVLAKTDSFSSLRKTITYIPPG